MCIRDRYSGFVGKALSIKVRDTADIPIDSSSYLLGNLTKRIWIDGSELYATDVYSDGTEESSPITAGGGLVGPALPYGTVVLTLDRSLDRDDAVVIPVRVYWGITAAVGGVHV